MNSSGRNLENDNRKLLALGKSVSCDNLKANSCIELADIRKLDSLLNQCESISCDNLLLFDDIYNYDLCRANRRKYASTSAINKILPKNSIRRRAHKKVLGIRESDTKIIKFLDDVRNRNGTDATPDASPIVIIDVDEEQMIPQTTNYCDAIDDLIQDDRHTIICCDKNIQTSQINLNATTLSPSITKSVTHNASTSTVTVVKCLCGNDKSTSSSSPATTTAAKMTRHVHDHHQHHQHHHHNHHEKASLSCKNNNNSSSKDRRKQCSCRDYKNEEKATNATICETSLSTIPTTTTRISRPSSAAVTSHHKKLKSRERSDEKSTSGKYNRLMKQNNTIIDDDEEGIIVGCETGSAGSKNSNGEGCHESRVININKSVEIIPISLNSPYCSRPATPHLGTSLHHDAKSDKSETQSQKSKRSKFSPSFISRKLTSRLNSSELEDGAGGAKESLLGRAKSADKKLPDPVETVCIRI